VASEQRRRNLASMLVAFERQHEVPREATIAMVHGWLGRASGQGRVFPADLTDGEYDTVAARLRDEAGRRIAAAQNGPPGEAPAPTGSYPAQSWTDSPPPQGDQPAPLSPQEAAILGSSDPNDCPF
jgi:hypothetical protein